MALSLPLKMIETSHVSPPAGSVPETSIPLTFFDVLWLHFSPVERLFFYSFQHSTSHFTSSCLPTLKSSLSLALQTFFPLAGNIRLTPETTNKYEIHYVDGDSVVFTVVESDDRYDEVFGDHPREISKLKALVPRLSKNESNGQQPVFTIQVTVFPSHGFVIGTSLHHSTCDGSGSVNFMCTWAAICRTSNSKVIPAPIPAWVELDRSIIPDPDSIYTTMLNDLSSSTNFNMDTSQPDLEMFIASYKLNREHIQLLRQVLLHEAEKRNVTVRCSTVVVTYAFVWVGYLKAKSTVYETEDAYCIFAIDHRQWFQPPIPESYFGNCIGPGSVQAKVKDLVGPNGFFEACQAIGKAFDEAKRIGIQNAKDWVEISLEIGSKKPFGSSGSIRFKVYDVDFGWGKPSKVDIASISYSGAMAVAPSREEEGGVEIGLYFTQRETDMFTNYFEESLQYMSTCIK
ncbi:coumaroyl-CoA:anthocyanidin 3-O-glucoside-6''-O-coumaroyltransferase 1-like [Carex rostrata]